MLRNFAVGVAAAALAVSSVAAHAAPAPRTPTPVGEEEQLAGSLLWLAIAAVVLAVGIYLIVDDGDEELPTSP